MIITKIKRIASTNRFHVYADDEWCGIFLDEVLALYHFKTGMEIDEDEFKEIKLENDEKVSFDMAASYLEKYVVSEKGLKDYLKKKNFDNIVIAKTINKLREYGFIDDEKFAKNYFENGYNCSQAVVLAFCEDFGLEKETAAMIAAPFGGGIGRLREVCGTFSGINMILGLAEGKNTQANRSKKTELYKDVQALAEKFKADNGSIICRDLLNLRIKSKDNPTPSERTDEYYKARPCSELCRYAADLLEQFLAENKKV